jgi:hypothetical protein
MSRSSLYRLFVDPFYTGLFFYLGERFEGKHRPMVSKREFDTVQRILGRSLKVSEKNFYHPFAGLVVCGVCGCQITAETHVKVGKTTGNARSYTYYHCTGRKGCPKLSIDEANMEGQILRDLEGCRLDPFFADWALDTIERESKEGEQLAKLTATTQTSSETSVTRRLESLYAMREDGEISRDEFVERKAKHQEELDQLQEAKYVKETKVERDRDTLKQILIFGKESYRDFTEGGKQAKRAVAQKFSHTYVLTRENLAISKHPALDRIRTFEPIKNQDHQSGSGGPDALIPIWRTMLDSIQKAVISCNDPFPLPPGFIGVRSE